jgi:hypothetical protein
MVAAKAESRPPCALALGFITGETHPTVRGLLDRRFADPTPGTEETRMAAGGTKRFAIVADQRCQFRAAVAAVMPEIFGRGRIYEPDLQVSRRSSI